MRRTRNRRRLGCGDRAERRPDAASCSRARICRCRTRTTRRLLPSRAGGYVLRRRRWRPAHRDVSPRARRWRSRLGGAAARRPTASPRVSCRCPRRRLRPTGRRATATRSCRRRSAALAVEAGITRCWRAYVGRDGDVVGHRPLRRVGTGRASSFDAFGLTADRRCARSASLARRRTGRVHRPVNSDLIRRRMNGPRSRCANCSTTPPSTAMACPPSTSTTWSRSRRSCRPPQETRQPGDPAGLGRRAQVRRRAVPAPPGAGGGRGVPGHPDRACTRTTAPRPAVCMQRHPLRLHQRDDGRLAAGGRQDARRATTTTST